MYFVTPHFCLHHFRCKFLFVLFCTPFWLVKVACLNTPISDAVFIACVIKMQNYLIIWDREINNYSLLLSINFCLYFTTLVHKFVFDLNPFYWDLRIGFYAQYEYELNVYETFIVAIDLVKKNFGKKENERCFISVEYLRKIYCPMHLHCLCSQNGEVEWSTLTWNSYAFKKSNQSCTTTVLICVNLRPYYPFLSLSSWPPKWICCWEIAKWR